MKAALLALLAVAPAFAAEEAWTVAGRQGLVLQVIVPEAQARERAAYQREIERLCEPERTCFINFYTNKGGAPLALPLPEAVAHESTATYRRSNKRGSDVFTWSCRLRVDNEPCF